MRCKLASVSCSLARTFADTFDEATRPHQFALQTRAGTDALSGMLRSAVDLGSACHWMVAAPTTRSRAVRLLLLLPVRVKLRSYQDMGQVAGKAFANYRQFHFHFEHFYVLSLFELPSLNITCSINPTHIVWKALDSNFDSRSSHFARGRPTTLVGRFDFSSRLPQKCTALTAIAGPRQ